MTDIPPDHDCGPTDDPNPLCGRVHPHAAPRRSAPQGEGPWTITFPTQPPPRRRGQTKPKPTKAERSQRLIKQRQAERKQERRRKREEEKRRLDGEA